MIIKKLPFLRENAIIYYVQKRVIEKTSLETRAGIFIIHVKQKLVIS